MPTIPFADLGRLDAELRAEIDDALKAVVDSGWLILGAHCSAFEDEFASYVGASHGVGVSNGTDAIELALRALDVGPGDEVVTQANTCVPTVAGIERSGAKAVLCDIEPEAGTIDPASLQAAIGPRTAAIVPVHLYGQVGDIDAVAQIASKRGLALVEDCAQAHGAEAGGRRAGTFGDVAAFSFYPTKNLGALGDAGAVVTSDDALAERLRMLRQYGQSSRYRHDLRGINSRLDELQAAPLRRKLRRLEAWTERRREIAGRYSDALKGGAVKPLGQLPDRRHVFHLYVVTTKDRDQAQARLEERGVQTLVHYPLPVHMHPAYTDLADGPVPLEQAERFCERILSLPLFPELTDDEVSVVAEAAAAG